MYVSRLSLKNWRNFRQVDVTLRRRTFLVGPNAVGKSNLLDVFRFLRDIALQGGGGLQKAMHDRGGLSKVRCLAARKDPVVEVTVTLSDEPSSDAVWIYSLGINQEPRGARQPIVEFERVEYNGKVLLNRPDDDDKLDGQRLTQTHLEQVNSNKLFRELAKYFESVTYLHLVPQLLRHPEAFVGPDLPGDPFGRGFLNRLSETREKTRTNRLKWIEKTLSMIVPQLTRLEFTKDDSGVPHLQALYEHWRPNAGKQREDQFSDGTLRLIALFWSLLEKDSLLLLEEPELSLNSSIVEKLAPLIAQSQRKRQRQVIVSSHSWALLNDPGVEPEGVLLLTPGENGTEVSLASDLEEVQQLVESGTPVAEAIRPLLNQRRFDFADSIPSD